jgi:UDP-glucose 4-epimerase
MHIEPPRPGDPPSLVADASQANAVLGWKPAHSDLASILKSQWDWRQKHPRGYQD